MTFLQWWRVQKWTFQVYWCIKFMKWSVRAGAKHLSPETLSAMNGVAYMIRSDIRKQRRWMNTD